MKVKGKWGKEVDCVGYDELGQVGSREMEGGDLLFPHQYEPNRLKHRVQASLKQKRSRFQLHLCAYTHKSKNVSGIAFHLL